LIPILTGSSYEKFAKDTSLRRPALICIGGGSNLELSHFRLENPPNVFNHIGEGTAVASISDKTLGAKLSWTVNPKITDGIAIGKSTHVTVTTTRISNQDDCVTFKPGANLVAVDRVTCSGSHGMSVGSLGKSENDIVTNVDVKNVHMIQSTKVAGIKTSPACNGHGVSTVSNVIFTGFKVEDCGYLIQIPEQLRM
jgi:galacturan 1,4-alpha-galacturonidase